MKYLLVFIMGFSTSAGLFAEVKVNEWGRLSNGDTAFLITLKHGSITAEISTYGAQIVSLTVPDKDGKPTNVVLGHKDLPNAENGQVLGSVIGRYANRISEGGFTIDGKRYDLQSVNPKTHIQIHGGKTGFQRQNWEVEKEPEKAGLTRHPNSITLRYVSPDGHEGFPGNLTVWVQYRVTESEDHADLEMEFRAKTDQPTHVNLTNHAYFNLNGGGTMKGQRIGAVPDQVLEFDERKIPTGKITSIEAIGLKPGNAHDLDPDSPGFIPLDHCFVTQKRNDEELAFAGSLIDGDGLGMMVFTTQPGVQIYTANHFKDNPFPKYGAICFETQHYPDTPNRPEFPSTLLRPGEVLNETTVYRFRLIDPVPEV